MNKYQKALDWFNGNKGWIDPYEFPEEYQSLFEEMLKRETPLKPKIVVLFGEEVPTCPTEKCGVGLNPNESIWHKSSYCGNCGQRIDWSDQHE